MMHDLYDCHHVDFPKHTETVAKELKAMEQSGIIENSYSEWAPPVVLVRKMDAPIRICVDYRLLNSVLQFDVYPMPQINELIDRLGKAKFIFALDLTRVYWQLPVAPRDQHKTAFGRKSCHLDLMVHRHYSSG